MPRRLTVSLEDDLEQAIEEAPGLLDLPPESSDSERLRAYARLGYQACRESKLDQERLATYRRWADAAELDEAARASFERAARHGVFTD